ncbi:carbohydrate ABC transporter permease [Bifidobacterium vespertilionis]|uniref:Sugar ABC transporter permease n=1 Tax=Bifidobacterium vespertilionis TaxID=2562524 RepID=A0A5J5DV72_9BIFI|nr:sugar ABC transporter permease [Bifidobacterium vespertilionis]KAA8820808.1 sugar ABC transporter permease [Bifidobacterium vespertilionis]KAA8822277.1 sugar ABC transporter permease [Bifidobacterium vespertilionis]
MTAATATPRTASKQKKWWTSASFKDNMASFWFLLPIIAIFVILTLIPLLQSFVYSFTDFDGYSTDFNFVGLENYATIFSDPTLLSSVGFTLLYAFGVTFFVTVLAIPLAVTLNKAMWFQGFARSLFFFLSVPAQAIIGLIWQYIFSPLGSGVANKFLAIFGLGPIGWLSQDNLARFCVIFVAVWMGVGWHATLYIAFLQNIPKDLYEQATVDGAGTFQQFVHITLPQLTPGIVTSMFLLMTGGLKIYDLPYTLTGGGPGYATYTITQSLLLRGIGQSQYGLGSALATLFTVACILVIFLQLAISGAVEKRFA